MRSNAAERADDLAEIAALELLDIGWEVESIGAALQRDVAWVHSAIDRAAAEAAGHEVIN